MKKTIALIFFILISAIGYFFWSGSRPVKNPEPRDVEQKTIQAEEIIEEEVTFAFGGDVMTDRYIWHSFKDVGLINILDQFDATIFKNSDLAMVNLEGPISDQPIDDVPHGSMIFNMPEDTVKVLQSMNINVISFANNHSLNAEDRGREITHHLLDRAGVKYAGNQNLVNEDSIVRFDTQIPVSIMCVNLIWFEHQNAVAESIRAEKLKGNFVIVFPHWGLEYETKHSEAQELAAELWIKSGADLIIGSHPHVVQDFEIIEKKPVVYSLGNLIFDQLFSTETQEGLIISGRYHRGKEKYLELTFNPTKQVNLKPKFVTGDEKTARINEIFDINSENGFIKISSDTIRIDYAKEEL